jgi:formylglycine-generating enzyme required for sulfatase activity
MRAKMNSTLYRVLRGGPFWFEPRDLSIADRSRGKPESVNGYCGFRVVVRKKS